MRVLIRNLGAHPFSLDIGDFYYGDMCRELLGPTGSDSDTTDIGDRVNVWDLQVQEFIRKLVVPEGSTRTLTTITGGYRVSATPAGQCSVDFIADDDDLTFLFTSGGLGGTTVAVSANDTTPDYLSMKLEAGSGISLSVQNPGANETLRIAATGGGALPAATDVGQVLFSLDGLTFEVAQPLTSDQGWLVNDEGTLLVAGG